MTPKENVALLTNVKAILDMARAHLGEGEMASSARLALEDAISLLESDCTCDSTDRALCPRTRATIRALESLAYSVGVFHPDYVSARRSVDRTLRPA